ncbi:hypothetical protein JAAARDRAFT_30458 [Jaapia argillacea MUCL 33604]|uniref:MATH domain-containing protein n=1 Tax=Jaapia argillacea MUCL 33604 TaxID=933084 RepID=A0A067Q6G6_9AGAM|nr:hypothetical protein JAAARDRAFT_30458 [Jaapia argillacea MUCL 33604]
MDSEIQVPVMDAVEYQESTTIKFDWTLRGLKNLFESSKGDSKSKVIKSAKFGGGRWQILFYANSGTGSSGVEGGGYVSLYLSCEPTAEEKEASLNGKWVREGLYTFSFALRNLTRSVLFNAKEAHDHSFSYRTANWGWAQFARRDAVYYQPTNVKQNDAFLIICTITSSPSVPIPPPPIPRKSVPKDLLDSVGALLDDPIYSDVEFIIPRRGQDVKEPRRIWAARRLLRRADYFNTMFNSGFAESTADPYTIEVRSPQPVVPPLDDAASDTGSFIRNFDDSDDEEEQMLVGEIDHLTFDERRGGGASRDTPDTPALMITVPMEGVSGPSTLAGGEGAEEASVVDSEGSLDATRNVRAKLSHPSSPRTKELAMERQDKRPSSPLDVVPGPKKFPIVVRDVAYSTYRAVLYYIYTDTIQFAPLSSSFLSSPSMGASTSTLSLPTQLPQESQGNLGAGLRATAQGESSATSVGPSSRREWIKDWEENNPGRPGPCSAKAVYRLADKLDLRELKDRAFQHIVKSLTVDNVPYEVFSTFSATFEDVRKVQVQFFLDHWADIRGSDAMRNVWQQIRLGRHPGFEEVWPMIALNLEFKPTAGDASSADGREGAGGEV